MSGPSSLRAGVRMTAVAAALVFCAGATLARAPSEPGLALPEPPAAVQAENQAAPPLRMAALEPANIAIEQATPPARPGPFGMAATTGGSFSARWHMLQPVIGIERQILALCRANPASCPAPAAKFSAIIEAARARSGHARIGEVNRAVNLAIRPVSDLAQYGAPDIWASPLTTFAAGAGDCEDYAIAKYVALREAGVPPEDLRLVVVHNRPANESHMVAAARVDGRWLILDNRSMRLVVDNDVAAYTPLAVLHSDDPAPAPAPAEASAGSWDTAGFIVAL